MSTGKEEPECLIRIQLSKSVDVFGAEGPEGKAQDHQIHSELFRCLGRADETRVDTVSRTLKEWLYRYGLDWGQFKSVEDEAGRFSHCRLEDEGASPDEGGKFIADYDLYIKMYVGHEEPVGKLGRECD